MEWIIYYIYDDYCLLDVTAYSFRDRNWCFIGTCCLHLQNLLIKVALVSLHSKTTRLNECIPYQITSKMRNSLHLIIFSEWYQWLQKHISIVIWNENISNMMYFMAFITAMCVEQSSGIFHGNTSIIMACFHSVYCALAAYWVLRETDPI
jgi:hypothetical protein